MKRRGSSRPPTPAAVILEPLSDHVLDVLFRQSIVGMERGDPYLDGVRRLARLIEAELQGQVFADANRRYTDWLRRHPTRQPKTLSSDELDARVKGGKARMAAMTDAEKSALGRLGGSKGGAALNAAKTPEQRKEAAAKAARARWCK